MGPRTKKNSANPTASTMLMLDNHRIPRATPETAEAMNPAVSTAMMTTAAALPEGPRPVKISTPRPICRAPMPRDAAVPNRVARIARMSMIRPARLSVLPLRKNGANTELMSGTRPRR